MKGLRRLEPLLNLHRLRRRVLKQLLAALRAQHSEIGKRIDELGREWMRVRVWNTENLATTGDAHNRRLAESWSLSAERETEDLGRRRSELARQIEDAERRFIKASQDLKMLSTLQERRAARERELELKHEQRELDELASHPGARS